MKNFKTHVWYSLIFILAVQSGCNSSKHTYQARHEKLLEETGLKVAEYRLKNNLNASSENTAIVSKPVVNEGPAGASAVVIEEAQKWMGTRYKMGGLTKKGIDCSGLMYVSYQKVGVTLPRVSRQQAQTGTAINKSELRPGDLVFFTYPGGSRITHVGMITQVNGDDITFIHASTSRGVTTDKLNSNYWEKIYVTARRPM
ncbi:C40 family peptidase [Limibacter armeniacum]|uniref:C40 family peptidase n=1 Tax=Limibacter armeniacum TaxID=466084 RepID=UPI002FE6B31F